jgi:hypothetical protein
MFHHTMVGHFDPRVVRPGHYACSRPLNAECVARLLAEYPPEVARLVVVRDGSARCEWTPDRRVFEFAYRLARQEGCLAVENGRQVTYPPGAARAQAESWEALFGRPGLADEMERQALLLAERLEAQGRAEPRAAPDPAGM